MEIIINGKTIDVDVEGDMPLLWVLRDVLNMTGTKYGCGITACGACTVLVEGEPARCCMLPVSFIEGKSVVTIEGLSDDGSLSALQQAWIKHQVPQCGYCQSGMIMAAASLLSKKPDPSDEDIDTAMTNICRCGTYQRVRAAIKEAAAISRNEIKQA